MFVPTSQVEDFVGELLDRPHEPDLVNRYVSISSPAFTRIAVTLSGFETFKRGALEDLYVAGGTIGAIYVVDVEDEIEDTRGRISQLEDEPSTGLRWSSSKREWEASGDEEALVRMRRLVAGLDDPTSTTSQFDLNIRLVRLASRWE